ncbi:MAG: hypothetical protein ACO27J_03910, partial [Ilumatobacteraceae bacterium]
MTPHLRRLLAALSVAMVASSTGVVSARTVAQARVTAQSVVPQKTTTTPTSTLVVLGDSLTWGTNFFAKSQSRLTAAQHFERGLVDSRWGRRISGLTSTR